MNVVASLYIFFTGLVLGSFFNVVGLRVPKRESLAFPPSHCPHCQKRLRAHELIPVISFLLQKGQCRSCKAKIPFLYPAVELITGILFVLVLFYLGFSAETIVGWLLVSLGMIVFVSDVRYMLIPDRILLFFVPFFLILRLTIAPIGQWWEPLAGAAVGFFLLFLIALASKGGMGGGDIKLFAILGVIFGWQGVLLVFFLAVFFGAVGGGIGILFGVVKKGVPMPFGPFIVLSAFIVYFFGSALLQWYIGFY